MASGQEIKEFVIRVRMESDDLSRGLQEVNQKLDNLNKAASEGKTSLTELNSGAELAKKGFDTLKLAYQIFVATIDRGQAVTELTNSFKALGGSSESLNSLRTATQGLASDMALMRASNQATMAGLSPDQFLKVAQAADTLGDAIGIDTKQSMDLLTNALVTGNDRLLKQFGILVDNKVAHEDYAKAIGVSVKELTEVGKREADRIAILDAIKKKTDELGSAEETAGDVMQRLGVKVDNAIDSFSQWINENTLVIESLKTIEATVTGLISLIKELAGAVRILPNVKSELQQYGGALGVPGLKLDPNNPDEFISIGTNEMFQNQLAAFQAAAQQNVFGPFGFNGALVATKPNKPKPKPKPIGSIGDQVDPLNFNMLFGSVAGGDIESAVSEAFGDKNLGKTILRQMEKMEDEAKDAFRNSVTFFEDILTTSITGSSQSMQQILTDALKRVAIGFGGELLAQIAGSMGLTNITGSLGSATGLGEGIAKAIFGEGGGMALGGDAATQAASSLSTSATSMASITSSLSALLPAAAAAAGIAATYFGSEAANRSGQGTANAWAAANALNPINQGLNAYQGGRNVLGGGRLTTSQQIALAAPTLGLSFAVNPVMDAFGISSGNSQLAAERQAREQMLESLKDRLGPDLSFSGIRGPLSLNASNFNIDTNNELKGQAVALANPFAQILSGGDKKLGSDLAAIFASATSEGKNFNEVLINTQSLIGKLGIDAAKAKDDITQLFLDGKVSLEDYQVDMQQLAIISQDVLQGPNGVADGFKVLAESIKTNPRAALQALGLEFNTFKNLGLKNTQEIIAYLTDKFGPEASVVFQQLASIGISSFEDIKNASSDEILQIFNVLNSLAEQLQSLASAGDQMGEGIKRGAQKARQALSTIGSDAEKTTRVLSQLSRANKNLGQDINKDLAPYRS